jgi:NAD(P)-dependent dehydrogenase (short-subunit alcohol dehydrogenase family)
MRWPSLEHGRLLLRAPLFLAEAFAAQAPTDGRASIINVLDQRVYRQIPRFFSYGLAKSALFAATGMLAQALAPNVRVNGVPSAQLIVQLNVSV